VWFAGAIASTDKRSAVINPFMVTEVYVKDKDKWKTAQLTFSQILRPVKLKTTTKEQ